MNTEVREFIFPGGTVLQLVQGDITTEQVEAIVNPANDHLVHGGGLAGVISRKGGPRIQQESYQWVKMHGPVTHDKPAYTSAGDLPFRYIIHVVGPVWGSGDEDRKLAAAIHGSLSLATELKLKSLAIPAVSTGIFDFPVNRAARVTLQAIQDYFSTNTHSSLKLVRMVVFDDKAVTAFRDAWKNLEK
jgi:putative ATPase